MDPNAIAIIAESTVALLSPYLKKTAVEIRELAGNIAVKKVGELLSAIKKRFDKNPRAQESLDALAQSPDDVKTKVAVQVSLKELLSSDKEFANQLAKILKETADAGADNVFNTTIYGDVQKLIQIGQVNGDVNIS